MRIKWLGAVLLLCLGSLLVVGHAAAQTPYTGDTLASMLLTQSDVGTALSAVGSDQSVTDSADGTPGGNGLANASRVLKTSTGIIGVALFANPDGSALSSDQSNLVLSGQILQLFAQGVFDNPSGFTLGGSAGIGDADQIAIFTGSIQGNSFNVVGDAFVKGNIFGAVFYATPLDADGTLLGALAQLQVMKLP